MLGRGLDYYDTHTIDTLVAELEEKRWPHNDTYQGIIESPAFVKTRFESTNLNRPI